MTIEDNGKSEEIEVERGTHVYTAQTYSGGIFLPWEHLADGSREGWGWKRRPDERGLIYALPFLELGREDPILILSGKCNDKPAASAR